MKEMEQYYIDFLHKNQPMPQDENLSEEMITIYDDARRFFEHHPNKLCIPLFLNSFGERDGFGVYQLVENLIFMFPKEEVQKTFN